jgi:hypothetical protein
MRAGLLIAIVLFFCCFHSATAQLIARFSIQTGNKNFDVPASICLDNITALPDSALQLKEINGNTSNIITFQIENGNQRYLWWMIGKNNSGTKRVFELYKNTSPELTHANAPMQLVNEDGNIVITAFNKKVLQYNCRIHYPPQGVDSSFKRSGFLHPLWSPSGNVLTQINPPDHYHHMGIWNPWTHVLFDQKEIDFWNLGDKKGTVRFSNFIGTYNGDVYAGFKALQQHIAFNLPAPGMETTAMNETWDVRVYNAGKKIWLIDFTSSLNCATDSAVILKEYRYGGFGFRASGEWDNANSSVLTSEGKNRKAADASTARWCLIDGDMQKGHSGILFMGYPTNYNFPEPMRVWPEDANKRGDVFFSFSPTRNKDWPLYPGKNYVLKYRMLVYDGTITQQQAEEAWKSFATPPKITIRIY